MQPRLRHVRIALAAAALAATAFSFPPRPAHAQPVGEEVLRDRFEGTFVRVRIDMPANQKGVDVYPQEKPNLDYSELARRIKRFGLSVRRGDEIQVTKVKVKKDLIEFQLGGGGYGTFGDDTDTDVGVPSAPKTQREKNLEQDLKRTTDPAKRRRIQEQIDDLRREREDARNEAIAAEANEARKEAVRSRAAEAGSRFNVRFRGPVPSSALEPKGLIEALGEFVVFDVGDRDADHATAGHPPGDDEADAPRGVAALRKGLTRAEVVELLGAPARVTPGREGTLKVERIAFTTEGETVDALFVEGVLVRYTVASR